MEAADGCRFFYHIPFYTAVIGDLLEFLTMTFLLEWGISPFAIMQDNGDANKNTAQALFLTKRQVIIIER